MRIKYAGWLKGGPADCPYVVYRLRDKDDQPLYFGHDSELRTADAGAFFQTVVAGG